MALKIIQIHIDQEINIFNVLIKFQNIFYVLIRVQKKKWHNKISSTAKVIIECFKSGIDESMKNPTQGFFSFLGTNKENPAQLTCSRLVQF